MDMIGLEPTLDEQIVGAGLIPVKEEPSQLDVAAAAFRQENIISSVVAREQNTGQPFRFDDRYDPFAELSDVEMEDWDRFVSVTTPEEAAAVRAQLDMEEADQRTIRESGASGVAWSMAAGLLDPISLGTMFLPLGSVGKLESAAKAALKVGASAAYGAGVTEAALQASQDARPWQVSAANIGGAALLGGLLGGVGQTLQHVSTNKVVADLNEQLRINAEQNGLEELPQGSMGAAQVVGTVAQEGVDIPLGLGINPMIRMLQSSSATMRNTVSRLLRHNFYTGKNAIEEVMPDGSKVVRHVENEIPIQVQVDRLKNGLHAQFTRDFREQWRAYTKRVPRGERVSYTQFREEAGRAMSNADMHAIPEIAATARSARKVITFMTQRLQKAGLLPEELVPVGARTYFPRVYSTKAITKSRVEWEAMLNKHFANAEADAAETLGAVQDTTSKILGQPDRFWSKHIVGGAGELKERVLDIPDDVLDPFLVKDIDKVLDRYLRSVAPELAMRERFGSIDMKSEISMIKSEYEALSEKASSSAAKEKLSKQMHRDINDLVFVRNMIMGHVRPPADGARFALNASKFTRGMAFMAQLGGMVMSAIPDLARPIMQEGFTAWVKALPRAFSGSMSKLSKSAKLSAAEKQLWQDVGIATDSLLSSRAINIGDIDGMNDFMGAASHTFARISLMNTWNSNMKFIAGFAYQNRVIRDIQKLATGGLSESAATKIRTQLARDGFSPDMTARVAKELEKHSEKISTSWSANTTEWTDIEARTLFESSILKRVDNTIVTPGVGDVPTILQSSELGRALGQFKSFLFASHSQAFLPMLQGMKRGDIQNLQGLFMMMSLGMLTRIAKMYADNRQAEIADYKTQDWVYAAIDESGVATIPSEVFGIADRMAPELLGDSFTGMMGMANSRRYYNRSLIESVAGPAIGWGERAAEVGFKGASAALDSEKDFTRADLYALRRLLPGQNLFYLKNLLTAGEEKIGDTFDLPGERRRSDTNAAKPHF